MKNIKKSLLPALLLLAVSCNEDELRQSVPVKQAKIDGVAVIDFPDGSIQADKVTIDKIDDPNVEYVFDETAEFFQVGNMVPYQIKLDIGQFPPESDRITATFTLPTDFLNSIPKNYGVELFALVYQDGGEEILDLFELLPSTRSNDGKSLTATLPIWIFTNKRNLSQTFEAVFMIASTPGDNSSGRISQPADDEECQAGQISCPLGSVEFCSQKKTSDFGQRTDPKTGKKNAVHWGLDFAAQVGTEIHAAADGVVERVRTQKDTKGTVIGYGLYIVIRHLNGSATLYAHLSGTNLIKGQKVTADQVIALSGNSGKSTGPHLHFEYVPNGEIIRSKNRINPAPCITSGNASGSLTVRDNGTAADDAFEMYLENILIGKTEIGQSNSLALSNLKPGEKRLKVVCTIAPDDAGTYEVLLDDEITFSDGSSSASGILPQGGNVEWIIIIPKKNILGRSVPKFRVTPKPNAFIEE